MKLIIYTDLHHYSGDRETAIFNKTQKLTQYAYPMLCQLIDKVNNEYKPDAVINIGDSIQDANDVDMDIVSLSEVADKIKEFNVPHYMVLGNHDLKMFDTFDEHKKIFGYDSFNYSVDIGGYHLVFMTNGIVPERGQVGGGVEKTHYAVKETVDWLKDDLSENTKPCIIFNHYPFLSRDGVFSRMDIQNVNELFEITDKYDNIMAVIAGHTHLAYNRERNGVSHFVLGSPIASLARNDIPDAVYYELDVNCGEITITEHKFKI